METAATKTAINSRQKRVDDLLRDYINAYFEAVADPANVRVIIQTNEVINTIDAKDIKLTIYKEYIFEKRDERGNEAKHWHVYSSKGEGVEISRLSNLFIYVKRLITRKSDKIKSIFADGY